MLVHINKKEEQENKIGNKGKFLIQMKKEGFNVPSGIILDTDTFDEIISKNNLIKKINDNLHKLEKNNLKEISKKLISLFNKISITFFLVLKILFSSNLILFSNICFSVKDLKLPFSESSPTIKKGPNIISDPISLFQCIPFILPSSLHIIITSSK